MLPSSHSTPQPRQAATTPLTPAGEAGTSSTSHKVNYERSLARRQLELCKAINRAAELEARNRVDEIQQEIDFETRFGEVLGE